VVVLFASARITVLNGIDLSTVTVSYFRVCRSNRTTNAESGPLDTVVPVVPVVPVVLVLVPLRTLPIPSLAMAYSTPNCRSPVSPTSAITVSIST